MSKKRYNFTNIDPDLYRKFKAACAYYGLDMREVFIKHMETIVADYQQAIVNEVRAKPKKGRKRE